MRLYLAASGTPYEGLDGLDGLRLLVSYWNISRGETDVVDWAEERGVPMFLDSGAYSAFTRGVPIDLGEYAAYVRDQEERFEAVAALDVIGDAAATRRNWIRMRELGADAIPTFHVGGAWSELRALARETGHLALGVAGHQARRQAVLAWCARAFREIGDVRGALARVHGFALTSSKMMRSFPWASVDSSTWYVAQRYGNAVVRDGLDFRQVPRRVYERDPSVLGRALGRVPRRWDTTEGYRMLVRHNAATMIRWVAELNRGREALAAHDGGNDGD